MRRWASVAITFELRDKASELILEGAVYFYPNRACIS